MKRPWGYDPDCPACNGSSELLRARNNLAKGPEEIRRDLEAIFGRATIEDALAVIEHSREILAEHERTQHHD
jgi:hypothetical protein